MSLGFDLAKINSDIGTTDSSSSESESDPDAEVENDSLQQEFLQTNANSAHQYYGNREELGTVSFQNDEPHKLLAHLREHKFNWISFVDTLKTDEAWITPLDLTDFVSQLPHMITSGELELFKESYQIYLDKQQDDARTNIKSKDDEIISESEENPEEWVGVDDLLHGPGKSLLQKKIQAVRLKRRREVAKKIAEERLLSRRSKHIGTICRTFPDIGKEIEAFVKSCGVGAEAWHRTGVLTFDGNKRVNKKCTFLRIKQHLEKTYGRKFAYGTVVQMCVARNRHRRPAQNYTTVAQVTTRRARKGFELRYNPDSHWSAALYRGLDVIQYTDGSDKLVLNRDDLSVFCLDSMVTHNKAGTQQIKGSPTLTMKTDYQANYPNKLQITSYNFTGTDNTGELCGGVVKAIPLHSLQESSSAHC